MASRANNGWIIIVTILLAVMLSIMPMPFKVSIFRPDWALLVLIYWSIALPNRVNVGVAWLVGIFMDVLLGAVLGLHGFVFAVVVYLATVNFQKIRNFSVLQQALVVAILVALYHLLLFWLQHFLTDITFHVSYLYPIFSTLLVWPWLFMLLRKTRRQFKVR